MAVASHPVTTEVSVIGELIPYATQASVTMDSTSEIRSQLDVSIVSRELVPTDVADLLAPYGNEITVKRDGIGLGVFRLYDVDIDDTPDGLAIKLSAPDRASRISDAKFVEPYQIVGGTNLATAIRDTVTAVYPDVETNFVTTSLTIPTVVAEEGQDRWAFCQDLAAVGGFELYFDGDGILVLAPIPTASAGDPDNELVEGDGGLLLSAGSRWTRRESFNRVIVTGENPNNATAFRGDALDDNPLSPTYYYGPFGQVPHFYSSEFIADANQAQDAATGLLARLLGTTRQINFGAIVDPTLRPGHVVRVTRERLGIDEDHVIDSVAIPLGASEPMSGQTRIARVS